MSATSSHFTPLAAAISITTVIVVGALLSLRSHQLLRHDRELVVHSLEVMSAADRVLIGALDAETGQRGFVITGNTDFLGPYEEATRRTIPASLARLADLTADNPRQLAMIETLRGLTDAKLAELGESVAARRSRGFSAAEPLVSERDGKKLMDDIRTSTRGIQDSEEALLAQRSAEVHQDEQRIILIIILTTFKSSLLRIGIAAWTDRRVRRVASCAP